MAIKLIGRDVVPDRHPRPSLLRTLQLGIFAIANTSCNKVWGIVVSATSAALFARSGHDAGARATDAGRLGNSLGTGSQDSGLTFQMDQIRGQVKKWRDSHNSWTKHQEQVRYPAG